MNDVLRLYRDVLRTDYFAYVKHSNGGYKTSKFHRFLCDTVQDFWKRKPVTHMIF